MKGICAIILLLLLTVMIFPSEALASSPISVYLDGQKIEFATDPVLSHGTTLVPFRAIFEKLGLRVTWDQENQRVFGDKDDLSIVLQVGNKIATVNGVSKELPVPPVLVKGSTLVPLRFIGEASGKNVEWDGETNTIKITTTSKGKNIFLNLREEDIKSAVEEGKKGFANANALASKNYSLKAVDNNPFILEAKIHTPYLAIVYASASKISENQDLSKDDINETVKELEEIIPFSVIMLGETVDFPETVYMALRQGDRVIQPLQLLGTDSPASKSEYWPEFPAYIALIGVEFSVEEIDFNSKAELIIKFLNELEAHYEIEFDKYK